MASDVNSVILIGNLTRDIEVSYLQSGTAVGNLSIAVNRSVKRGDKWEDEASFFDVTLFGKSAETLKQYLTKGKKIAVQGSLRQERWQDKETGKTRSRVSVIADNIQLLGGNPNGGHGGQAANVPPSVGFDGNMTSDIPF